MNKEQFEKQIKHRENIWNFIFTLIIVSSIGFAVVSYIFLTSTEFSNNPVGYIFELIFIAVGIGMGVSLFILKSIEEWVRNSLLKPYYIEDCDSVIKLHGGVRAMQMNKAYRDLLSIRPGYKIVENAFETYGCTLAAVKASHEDIEAKKQIESLGFYVNTIG